MDNMRYGLYAFAPFNCTLACPLLSAGTAVEEGILAKESVLKVKELKSTHNPNVKAKL